MLEISAFSYASSNICNTLKDKSYLRNNAYWQYIDLRPRCGRRCTR